MTFLIVTHVLHKKNRSGLYAYGPYVREMNLWSKYADRILIVAPVASAAPAEIDVAYGHGHIQVLKAPLLDFTSFKQAFISALSLPVACFQVIKGMVKADHIHLRCPGNYGLLGCFMQIMFPWKNKTAKYAGNWDWNGWQPWSYRLQQRLLRNTRLSRNLTALVYGEWPDRNDNIKPFFTASYTESELGETTPRPLSASNPVWLIFAGSLTENKRPQLALQVAMLLNRSGLDVRLDFYGDGPLRENLGSAIEQSELHEKVRLHGNVNAEVLKIAYSRAHFLVFASRSEGWPKVVAEAMAWACLPLTTAVSCVPYMIGNGKRGDLIEPDPEQIAGKIKVYLEDEALYESKCRAAMRWSRQFTLDRFEREIKHLLDH